MGSVSVCAKVLAPSLARQAEKEAMAPGGVVGLWVRCVCCMRTRYGVYERNTTREREKAAGSGRLGADRYASRAQFASNFQLLSFSRPSLAGNAQWLRLLVPYIRRVHEAHVGVRAQLHPGMSGPSVLDSGTM
jgi:hypothetical protein